MESKGYKMNAKQVLSEIEAVGKKARGQGDIIKFLRDGKKLSWGKLIRAKCYDCMGYYADGKVDCGNSTCPIYPYMPYTHVKSVEDEVDDTEE